MSQELRQLENQLIANNPPNADASRQRLTQIRQRINQIRPIAEETIESQITAVLKNEGLQSPLGIILPPVDTALTPSPTLLVTSPRHRIHRQDNILLRHGLPPNDREHIEQQTLNHRNLSAIVVNTGGIGTYPSVVSPDAGMHYAITTAAHEWLHNWFFFRPLGRNFWRSPEMTTLNETAATLAGWEIGDQAYTALTGISVNRPQPTPTPATPTPSQPDPESNPDPQSQAESNPDTQAQAESNPDTQTQAEFNPDTQTQAESNPDAQAESDPQPQPHAEAESAHSTPAPSDFNAEMRQTRQRAEQLLAANQIPQAESYMESRRQQLLTQGYPIRKINQAYFAFYGSYATSPASTSPIETQLRNLRQTSPTLSHFLNTIAQFATYQQFLNHIQPPPPLPIPNPG